MNLIRELRFGPPKCWKTGSIVSSYPRPLLVLNIDDGGLDVIKEPVTLIPRDEATVATWCQKKTADLPPLAAIDFYQGVQRLILDVYQPQGNKASFDSFIKAVNKLVTVGCPWKTIVMDGVTGLDDIIRMHNAAVNPGSLGDGRKWGGNVGAKIQQIMGVMCGLPANVVFISHATAPDASEETKEIFIGVVMTGQKLRSIAGGLVSQFFYQEKKGGKSIVHTTDFGFVKGIGCRWPQPIPAEVGPTYKEIYELNGNS